MHLVEKTFAQQAHRAINSGYNHHISPPFHFSWKSRFNKNVARAALIYSDHIDELLSMFIVSCTSDHWCTIINRISYPLTGDWINSLLTETHDLVHSWVWRNMLSVKFLELRAKYNTKLCTRCIHEHNHEECSWTNLIDDIRLVQNPWGCHLCQSDCA